MRTNLVSISRMLVLLFCLSALQQALAAPSIKPVPTAKQIVPMVDAYMQAAIEHDQFSGTVLIARDGVPLVSKGYGMANYELSVPNSPATVFGIASLTKQFTALAVMQLQERGKLKTSDRICEYLDDCPGSWQVITIHQLLTHTSGIPNFSSKPDWDEKISLQSYTRQGFVDVFRDDPLQFAPGEKLKYSNSGYYLLGLIIERASKKTFAKFLEEEIFVPLGMKNSGLEDLRTLVPNHASGYYTSLNSFVKPPYMNAVSAYSNGGMHSTTGDLLLWDAALYSDKLVSRKSRDEIFTPFMEGYGYGWKIGKKFDRPITEHSGSHNGFSTFILRFPSEHVTVIVLSNSDRTSATKAAYNLAAMVFGETVNFPKPQLRDVMTATILKDGVSAAIGQYRELQRVQSKAYDLGDEVLIDTGYDFLENGKVDDAIEVFKLGLEFFPKSSDFHDSLGHAYIEKGDRDLAIRSFEKMLEIEPDSEHGASMLKDLRDNGIKP